MAGRPDRVVTGYETAMAIVVVVGSGVAAAMCLGAVVEAARTLWVVLRRRRR